MKLNKKQKDLVKEAEALVKQIEKLKKSYSRMDEIIEELLKLKTNTGELSSKISLVNNFESKNTAFKASFFKQYEIVENKKKVK